MVIGHEGIVPDLLRRLGVVLLLVVVATLILWADRGGLR